SELYTARSGVRRLPSHRGTVLPVLQPIPRPPDTIRTVRLSQQSGRRGMTWRVGLEDRGFALTARRKPGLFRSSSRTTTKVSLLGTALAINRRRALRER